MSEILENLFGGKERARIMRFFLQNPDKEFELADIYTKNLLDKKKSKKETDNLVKIKFITKRKRKGKTTNPRLSSPARMNLSRKVKMRQQMNMIKSMKERMNLNRVMISELVFLVSSERKDTQLQLKTINSLL